MGDGLKNIVDCVGSLYQCHRYECNRCFPRKAYWLREQAVNFAFALPANETFFTVIKHFENARDADDLMKHIIKCEKSLKSKHRHKFEYFYVIANHGFSGWHLHIISNRHFPQADYSEPVEKRKAAALYLVKNLEMSRFQEYGCRRYGGSALLNKQNKKNAFKNRLRLWRLRFIVTLIKKLIWLALVTIAYSAKWIESPALFDGLRYVPISQARRNYRGRTEELVFRKPRDDLIG